MAYSFEDLKTACLKDWRDYTEHSFVIGLGTGKLKHEAFCYYLQQDYLFLRQLGRAYGLVAYKSRTMDELRWATDGLKALLDEFTLLLFPLCQNWNISKDQLDRQREAPATQAYSRYVLDVSNWGDLLDLRVALAPCMVGYGEIARDLSRWPSALHSDNPYANWISMYASNEMQRAMRAETIWLDTRMAEIGEERFNKLVKVFGDATRLEINFWQMSLDSVKPPV